MHRAVAHSCMRSSRTPKGAHSCLEKEAEEVHTFAGHMLNA